MTATGIGSEEVDWINLADDRGKWGAAVNTITQLQVVHTDS
jgi:hypothetical protein